MAKNVPKTQFIWDITYFQILYFRKEAPNQYQDLRIETDGFFICKTCEKNSFAWDLVKLKTPTDFLVTSDNVMNS